MCGSYKIAAAYTVWQCVLLCAPYIEACDARAPLATNQKRESLEEGDGWACLLRLATRELSAVLLENSGATRHVVPNSA